MSTLMQIKIP